MRIVIILILTLPLIVFGQDIKISEKMADTVKTGSKFNCEITIEKGNLTTFAKLKQDLPYGMKATATKLAGADFSFSDKELTFTWMRMPETTTLVVAYEISPDENLSGEFFIDGEFMFFANGKKTSTKVPEMRILLSDDMKTESTDSAETKKDVKPKVEIKKEIAATRSMIAMNSGKEFIINIKISKPGIASAGLITEKIPEGYAAFDLNKNDKFIFKDNKVEYQWLRLPAEDSLNLSYKLIPKDLEKNEKPYIAGEFIYFDTENNKQTLIIRNETKKNQPETKESEVKTTDASELKKGQTSFYDLENEKTVSIFEAADSYTAYRESKIQKTENKKIQKSTSTKSNNNTAKQTKKTKTTSIPKKKYKKKLLTYRIQIYESKEPVAPNFFKKYRIEGVVMAEKNGNKYTYTMGSFKSKNEAEKYRLEIIQKTLINKTSIVTYDHGERISK